MVSIEQYITLCYVSFDQKTNCILPSSSDRRGVGVGRMRPHKFDGEQSSEILKGTSVLWVWLTLIFSHKR